jgi:hypothetical protein
MLFEKISFSIKDESILCMWIFTFEFGYYLYTKIKLSNIEVNVRTSSE